MVAKKSLLLLGGLVSITFLRSFLLSYAKEIKYHIGANIALAITDLNRDGYPDVIVRSENGYLYAIDDDDGHILWKFKISNR